MKIHPLLFSLIVLLGFSCQNRVIGQIPPPPASTTGKPDPEGKIERELQEMERATRLIIEQYANLPRPGVYMAPFSPWQPDCGEAAYGSLVRFDADFINAFPLSSIATRNEDGQFICLRTFHAAKILYRRTEGGHSDDAIDLVSVKEDSFCRLPLYLHFGKEGYDLLIQSELDGRLIRRTVVERYGWESDPEKQPRSETLQLFRLEKDGSIALVEEETMQVSAPPAKN
jgi:hypothetical protein